MQLRLCSLLPWAWSQSSPLYTPKIITWNPETTGEASFQHQGVYIFLVFCFFKQQFLPPKNQNLRISQQISQPNRRASLRHASRWLAKWRIFLHMACRAKFVRPKWQKKNGKKWWQSKVISHKLKKVIRGFVNLFSITFESLSNRAIRFFAPLWRTQRPWSRKISIWRRWSWFFSRTHAQPAKNSFRFPRAYFLGDSQIIQQKLNSFAGCLVRRQSVTVNSNPSKKDSRVKC